METSRRSGRWPADVKARCRGMPAHIGIVVRCIMRLPGGKIGADLCFRDARFDEFAYFGDEGLSHGLNAQFPLHGLSHHYGLAVPARRAHHREIAVDCLSHNMVGETWSRFQI